jgi:hypothetical protein
MGSWPVPTLLADRPPFRCRRCVLFALCSSSLIDWTSPVEIFLSQVNLSFSTHLQKLCLCTFSFGSRKTLSTTVPSMFARIGSLDIFVGYVKRGLSSCNAHGVLSFEYASHGTSESDPELGACRSPLFRTEQLRNLSVTALFGLLLNQEIRFPSPTNTL